MQMQSAPGSPLRLAKNYLQKSMIEEALKCSNGNKVKTARELGISRPQLYILLNKYGIK